MSIANYIKNNFIGKELCFSISNGETETILYDTIWTQNREYLQGVVIDVEDDIVVLEINDWGTMYINSDEISLFWLPGKNLHAAFSASLTKKLGRQVRKPGD